MQSHPRVALWNVLATLMLWCPVAGAKPIAVKSVHQDPEGVRLVMQVGTMRVQVCTERIVRVVYSPTDRIPAPLVNVVTRAWKPVAFAVKDSGDDVVISTPELQVKVNRASGAVSFFDASGQPILEEPADGGKSMAAATVAGQSTWQPEQIFDSPPDEALYGLGQYQDGLMNWRGIPLRLQQVNTHISIPMLLSTKGYGLLWNNPSWTDFDPADELIKTDPTTGEGKFTSGSSGVYGFFIGGGDRKDELVLKVNGEPVIDLHNMWLPSSTSGKLRLAANTQYTVVLKGGGANARAYFRPPQDTTCFRSQAGSAIDYYFMYGPDLNQVIAQYRETTGDAPLFPKWAYGFWQCRERYSSQKQLLDAAAAFRQRQIPVDVIVQDWQYWGKYGWNALKFDEQYYPDPAQMLRQLHAEDVHFAISVWSRYGPETDVYKRMQAESLLVPGTPWIDAFNPKARQLLWAEMDKGLFDLGVDGWWMDATEPEDDPLKDKPTALGMGNFVRNAYPLYVTDAVYQGQRESSENKRVCILTRSAFAGQQRNAAACWSGDISGNWITLRRQIPAGLNFCMAGIPYWTTDVGGFFRPADQYKSVAYHELLIRWFEYGAFCPIFRIHGYKSETEMWNFGPEVEKDLRKYDELRYRLMPYVYSTAWRVTHQGYTMMRALPVDFQADPNVRQIADQFMFGPSLLVNPVTEAGATARSLYLPKDAGWVDFWTGRRMQGGQTVRAAAPLDTLPLYAEAGSIVPMGPVEQYAAEKSDPVELRIYPGRNASFVLYEDQNDGYDYEKGAFATIPISWDQKTRELTIGPRQGDFPGMLKERTFRLVWVRPAHGTGLAVTENPDAEVHFTGPAVETSAPQSAAAD